VYSCRNLYKINKKIILAEAIKEEEYKRFRMNGSAFEAYVYY